MDAADPKIIEVLNDVLCAELTAINQYFLHAEMCNDWGYERLYKKIRGKRHYFGYAREWQAAVEK